MTHVLNLIIFLMLISLALVVVRLLRGPSLADRALAGDQISIHVVMIIIVYSIATDQEMLIDLVIVTAIVGFISTAVIGIYIDRGTRGKIRAESAE
ncbi:MAG: multiple resistance and pH regulation protein F [Chloroflexi bacterium OLB15]|nr:MAG: multiple resistance and pH regulation protein F [Chloroflexi bacterium OLB15]